MTDLDHEQHHRVALARELTYARGVPLRDRYGFASSDEQVLRVLQLIGYHVNDAEAADAIGGANAVGDLELAWAYEPIDERQELEIVRALRPLLAQRAAAEDRSKR